MEVAHGEIKISVNDRDALADLQRVQAQYHRAMAAIDNEEARAQIDADIRPFERAVSKAKRELRELQGKRAEKIAIGADTDELDRKIKETQLRVKKLDGSKATVEIKVAGERQVLEAENRIIKAQERRAAAELKNQRAVQKATYDATVGAAKQRAQIIQLQREYARLTDQVENFSRKQAFTREGRAKLELDTSGAVAKMAAIKAQLNAMGSHPPVDIKVDIARTRLGRIKQDFADMAGRTAEWASTLSQTTVRLGPFTTTIKGLGVALSILGPTLTDVAGAAGALIGVAGAGLAGAMTVGSAAVTGMAFGLGGLLISSRNVGQELGNARATIDAYQKAVEKFGKNSDEAKKKQDQMNNTLKTISPVARESALGIERFYDRWDARTGKTQKSFGNIARNGFRALDAITPMWAASTNKLSGILDRNLRSGFKFLKGGEFKQDFKGITDGFNAMMPSILRAAGSLGRAFLNFGREGAKFLPQLGEGIESLADKALAFTQRDDFGARVKTWVGYAKDLGKFFGAATRVVTHFFGAGAKAGDSLLQAMTAALNKYDEFLTSTGGRNSISEGFGRAADGARALWNAIAPIAGAFVEWASNLSPFITGLLQGVSIVSRLVGKLGDIAGMSGAISAIGVTLGAAFAVGKIGSFLAGLARVYALMRSIKSIGEIGKLAGIGSAFKGAGITGAFSTGGAAAAGEIRAGMVSGGAAAAAEIRAAMMTGGAAGGIAGGVGEFADDIPFGRRGKAMTTVAKNADNAGAAVAKTAGKFALGTAAASALSTAVSALPFVAMGAAATAAGGAALYFGSKLIFSGNAAQDAQKRYGESKKTADDAASAYRDLAGSSQQVALTQAQASMNMKEARRAMNDTQKGTTAHRQAMLNYRQAVIDADRADQDWTNTRKAAEKSARDQVLNTEKQAVAANKLVEETKKFQKTGAAQMHPEAAQKRLNDALAQQEVIQNKIVSAQNRQAAVASNYARIYRGLTPLLGQAEQKVGALARSAPKLAKTVSVKYEASGDVSRVAASASRALTAGVPKRIVTKIVADSKDAESAVSRLNSKTATLKDKKIKLGASDTASAQVSGLTKRITGVPGSKTTNLKARDGASGTISKVTGAANKVPASKQTGLKAIDNASGTIARVIGLVNSLPSSRTTTLTTIHLTKFQTSGSDSRTHGGARAGGGSAIDAGAANSALQIARAAKDASNRPLSKALSQRVSGPKYLVGEERGFPEFVIATNPSYRRNNLRFLGQAARALGQEVIPAAVGYSGAGAYASDSIPFIRKAKKKLGKPHPRKGGKKANIKQRRSWTTYMDDLQVARDDWSRELSIREGAVEEPETMVVQTGEQPVVDDTGKAVLDEKGKQLKTPVYGPNPDIEPYKQQLQSVLDAFKQLLATISEIVRATPLAQAAIDIETKMRGQTVNQLDHTIAKARKDMRQAKGDKKDKFRDTIDKARADRDREEGVIKELRDDRKELTGVRKEAGFSFREESARRQDVRDELSTVSDKAVAEAAKQTLEEFTSAQGSGAAGGDGTSGSGAAAGDALSPAAQYAAFDTAKSELYKQFGGNTTLGGRGVAGFGGSGGPNLSLNPSGPLGASVITGADGGGSASGAAIAGSARAAMAVSSGGGGGSMGTMGGVPGAAASGGPTNVTINNTFATVPPDPHTWSKGVEFELGGIL